MEIIDTVLKRTILFKDRTCDVWSEFIEGQYLAYQIPGTTDPGVYEISVEYNSKNSIGDSDKTLFAELGWKDSNNADRAIDGETIQFNDVVSGSYGKIPFSRFYHNGGSHITLITQGEFEGTSLGNEEVEGGVSFDLRITIEKIA